MEAQLAAAARQRQQRFFVRMPSGRGSRARRKLSCPTQDDSRKVVWPTFDGLEIQRPFPHKTHCGLKRILVRKLNKITQRLRDLRYLESVGSREKLLVNYANV